MIDVTKISFIAFDETAREGAIVVDGQLIKLNINKDIYIDFIKAFAIEHPMTNRASAYKLPGTGDEGGLKEQLFKIFVRPRRLFPPPDNTALRRGIRAGCRQRGLPQYRHVFRPVVFPQPGTVFPKGRIKHVM
jgi:hypothetical protein